VCHLRGPVQAARVGTAPASASFSPSFPEAMADLAELCSQLLVYRYCVGQSSLSAALRHGSRAAPVVQFCSSIFRVSATALDGVDGGEQAFAPAGRLLRGGLFLRQRDLYLVNLGTDRTSGRRSFESPPEHAISLHRDSVSFL